MKPEEAQTLVTMMAAATSTRLLNDEKLVWEEYFLPLDADIAYRAIMSGRRTWARFPSWKLFKEVYNSEKSLSEPAGEQRSQMPADEGRRGIEAPEWVWVWYWCREKRAPRNLRHFPQQDQPDSMSLEEYAALQSEWVAAGKPKARTLLPSLRSA